MKYLFIVVTSLVFFTSLNFTQLNAQIGLKAGLISSSISLDGSPSDFVEVNSESIIGYQFGVVYNIGIGNKFSIQPEVAFSRTGNRLVVDPIDMDPSTEVTTEYSNLNLTAIAQYNLIGNNDGLRLYVLGGGFGEYLFSELTIFNLGGNINSLKQDLENDEFFNRLNYGLTVGVGVGLNSFFVQLRGAFGLTNLNSISFTDINGEVLGQAENNSRYYSLIVGYLF